MCVCVCVGCSFSFRFYLSVTLSFFHIYGKWEKNPKNNWNWLYMYRLIECVLFVRVNGHSALEFFSDFKVWPIEIRCRNYVISMRISLSLSLSRVLLGLAFFVFRQNSNSFSISICWWRFHSLSGIMVHNMFGLLSLDSSKHGELWSIFTHSRTDTDIVYSHQLTIASIEYIWFMMLLSHCLLFLHLSLH